MSPYSRCHPVLQIWRTKAVRGGEEERRRGMMFVVLQVAVFGPVVVHVMHPLFGRYVARE